MIGFDQLKPHKGPTIPSPLVPEDGLYLYDPGIWFRSNRLLTPSTITKKFTRAFQKAWSQIPESDRKTLREFWGPSEPIRPGVRPTPGIWLNSANLPIGLSAACRGGHELLFDVLVVDDDTPTSIVHIVAHELGHAISYPHGWHHQHECKADLGEECVPCEWRAYSYMAAWGFDPFHGWLPKRQNLVDRFTAFNRQSVTMIVRERKGEVIGE
jgi:hypothetical protein